MNPLRIAALLGLAGSLLGLAACPDDATGSLVVGITSDYQAGSQLDRLEVSMQVDGEVINAQTLTLGPGATEFPAELTFDALEEGSDVSVMLRGFSGAARVVERYAETQALADQTALLRVHLESTCRLGAADPSNPVPPAPECSVPQTCIRGQCRDSFVHPGELEPYEPGWHESSAGDICKPADAGAPSVTVGRGQSDYLKAEDYEVAQVEAGAQGGHHIWVAARVKNLRRSGSITEVAGEIPDLNLQISPLKVIFTMDPDEGGFCKIYGLRFQIDIDGGDINDMLGKDMKVTVSISDSDGAVGTGELWVTLSSDIK
jgi:hypothetical protein